MKQTYLLFALFVCSSFKGFAQDTITKTDGSTILAKVLEINANEVRYKRPALGSETVFVISPKEVASISYPGGLKEVYNVITPKTPAATTTTTTSTYVYEPKPLYTNPLKNVIAINCFDMYYTSFSVSYERIFKEGKTSLKIPVAFGLGGRPDKDEYDPDLVSPYMRNKIYSAGLEFNVYPFGQTRSTFYVGISAAVGSFNYYRMRYDTIYTPPNGSNGTNGSYRYPELGEEKKTAPHYSGMIHLGGYLGISEHFAIGTKMAVGFKREETIYEDFTTFTGQFDVNLAYRF